MDDVLDLYAEVFDCSFEDARDQLRNEPGLQGALMRPRTHAHYKNADIALQAAALADGIAETQPFIEGNKRTALAALLTFVAINGYELSATQNERASWILRLSSGLTVDALAQLIRKSLSIAGPG